MGGHDDYKKVPKGYRARPSAGGIPEDEGPDRRQFPAMPRGMLHRADLVDWLVEHGKAVAPMVSWLDVSVG